MKNSTVRLQKIELTNFKNVNKGTLSYSKTSNGEQINNIIGIYGQNGSGKTSIVDGLSLFKQVLSGDKLSNDLINLISLHENKANLDFEFLITIKEKIYRVFYSFEIKKIENNLSENESNKNNIKIVAKVSKEKLSYSKFEDNKWTNRTTIIDYDIEFEKIVFKPKIRYQEAISVSKESEIQFIVAKEMSKELGTSFIFNKKSINLYEKVFVNKPEYTEIIYSLSFFARYNLFVIKNDELGIINTNEAMPFSFRIEGDGDWYTGNIKIRLFDVSTIETDKFEVLEKIIRQINVVINAIIPQLNVELVNYGNELLQNGSEGMKVELVSRRGDNKIPLKYESDGIKKIISILSALIAMYNNENILLAIDELDAGVFEYLLGEILEVISENAKGQLIFTSHNLRALEKLDKESIVFTTTNPDNRYITLSNVKSNNNLRDFYLRGILLGGQKEDIYEGTNKFEIAHAFRKAWKR